MGAKSTSRTTRTSSGGFGYQPHFAEPEPEKHDAHVGCYREWLEWINRPWTWRNRAAWAINKLLGE